MMGGKEECTCRGGRGRREKEEGGDRGSNEFL